MALLPEPPIEGLPILEVFGAKLEEANGKYMPTKYDNLVDGYFAEYFAPRSGKPTWQRRIDEGRYYILIFFNAEATHVASSSWKLYAGYEGCSHGLYHHTSPPDGMLPPESGWLEISGDSDSEPAPLLSVREPRPPLLVNVGFASASDGGYICKSCLSGDQLASFPGTLSLVKDIKAPLMARFHQYVVIMMPSGAALTEDQEKYGSLSDIAAGKIPEESVLQARRALLESVRSGDKRMQTFSNDEFADRELVLAALEHDGLSLEFAAEEMRRDSSVVWTAVMQRGDAYAFAMGEALENRSLALLAVSQSGDLLQNVDTKLLMDKGLIFAACSQNPDLAWPFVPQSMRQDRELLWLVLDHSPPTNLHYSKRIPNLQDFQSLCDGRELQMAAVRRKPSLFQHALPELRADRAFVLELLPKTDMVEFIWPYVSDELKRNPEVALRAIKCSSPAAFSLAAEELQLDRSFILQVLAETCLGDGCFFKYLPKDFTGDREIALTALQRKGCNTLEVLTMVSEDLRQDREFLVELIQKDKTGLVFRDLSDPLRSDAVLAQAATRSCLKALEYVSGSLRADPEFVMSVIAVAVEMDYNTSDVLRYVAEELKNSNEFCQRVKEAYPEEKEDVEFDIFG